MGKKDVISLSKNAIKQRSDNYLDWTITKALLHDCNNVYH